MELGVALLVACHCAFAPPQKLEVELRAEHVQRELLEFGGIREDVFGIPSVEVQVLVDDTCLLEVGDQHLQAVVGGCALPL